MPPFKKYLHRQHSNFLQIIFKIKGYFFTMSIATNTHAPYVVRNVIRDNWSLVANKPAVDPIFVLIEDFIGHRIPDNLHNYIMMHQKGKAKDSKFSTITNSDYYAYYDVSISIKAFSRVLLISYYTHLLKVMNLKRENPSPLHTLLHRQSFSDESNRANRQFKIILIVRLYSQHQTL